MGNYDKTKEETLEHIRKTALYINIIRDILKSRAENHDHTKLESPEIDYFVNQDSKALDIKYGTEEYQKSLDELKPALDHHYAKNRHHPQHYPNGIKGMNLVDLCEMLCDWKSSSDRYKEGNILKSIEVNTERFNISEDLASVLRNTAELFELI